MSTSDKDTKAVPAASAAPAKPAAPRQSVGEEVFDSEEMETETNTTRQSRDLSHWGSEVDSPDSNEEKSLSFADIDQEDDTDEIDLSTRPAPQRTASAPTPKPATPAAPLPQRPASAPVAAAKGNPDEEKAASAFQSVFKSGFAEQMVELAKGRSAGTNKSEWEEKITAAGVKVRELNNVLKAVQKDLGINVANMTAGTPAAYIKSQDALEKYVASQQDSIKQATAEIAPKPSLLSRMWQRLTGTTPAPTQPQRTASAPPPNLATPAAPPSPSVESPKTAVADVSEEKAQEPLDEIAINQMWGHTERKHLDASEANKTARTAEFNNPQRNTGRMATLEAVGAQLKADGAAIKAIKAEQLGTLPGVVNTPEMQKLQQKYDGEDTKPISKRLEAEVKTNAATEKSTPPAPVEAAEVSESKEAEADAAEEDAPAPPTTQGTTSQATSRFSLFSTVVQFLRRMNVITNAEEKAQAPERAPLPPVDTKNEAAKFKSAPAELRQVALAQSAVRKSAAEYAIPLTQKQIDVIKGQLSSAKSLLNALERSINSIPESQHAAFLEEIRNNGPALAYIKDMKELKAFVASAQESVAIVDQALPVETRPRSVPVSKRATINPTPPTVRAASAPPKTVHQRLDTVINDVRQRTVTLKADIKRQTTILEPKDLNLLARVERNLDEIPLSTHPGIKRIDYVATLMLEEAQGLQEQVEGIESRAEHKPEMGDSEIADIVDDAPDQARAVDVKADGSVVEIPQPPASSDRPRAKAAWNQIRNSAPPERHLPIPNVEEKVRAKSMPPQPKTAPVFDEIEALLNENDEIEALLNENYDDDMQDYEDSELSDSTDVDVGMDEAEKFAESTDVDVGMDEAEKFAESLVNDELPSRASTNTATPKAPAATSKNQGRALPATPPTETDGKVRPLPAAPKKEAKRASTNTATPKAPATPSKNEGRKLPATPPKVEAKKANTSQAQRNMPPPKKSLPPNPKNADGTDIASPSKRNPTPKGQTAASPLKASTTRNGRDPDFNTTCKNTAAAKEANTTRALPKLPPETQTQTQTQTRAPGRN